ncbi:MAG: hypothetical protein ACXAEU_26060 [Candidatus Hodarchaeales archaeon]
MDDQDAVSDSLPEELSLGNEPYLITCPRCSTRFSIPTSNVFFFKNHSPSEFQCPNCSFKLVDTVPCDKNSPEKHFIAITPAFLNFPANKMFGGDRYYTAKPRYFDQSE